MGANGAELDLDGKVVLVTGGTGSFGKAFINEPARARTTRGPIRIFSRDELKQYELAGALRRRPRALPDRRRARPRPRCERATRGVDVDRPRRRAEAGPDLRVQPVRGGPDERHRRRERRRGGDRRTTCRRRSRSAPTRPSTRSTSTARRSCAPRRSSRRATPTRATRRALRVSVRYGNVVGSRGSVIPLFKRQATTGELTITDERDDALLDHARPGGRVRAQLARPRWSGGEVFVPKIPSMRDRRPRRRRSRRTPSRGSSASGPARSCTRCCSPRTRRATRSASTTTSRSIPSFPFWREGTVPGGRGAAARATRTRATRTRTGCRRMRSERCPTAFLLRRARCSSRRRSSSDSWIVGSSSSMVARADSWFPHSTAFHRLPEHLCASSQTPRLSYARSQTKG